MATVTETELVKFPPLGVIVGVATVDMTAGAVTVSGKPVVLVIEPLVALMVTEKIPAGVDPVMVILSIVEQVRVQEEGEKDPVAPEGNPETPNVTA